MSQLNTVAYEINATLPLGDVFFVSSLGKNGGRAGIICDATRKLTGELLARDTHRICTPEEIQTYLDEQEKLRFEYEAKRVTPLNMNSLAQLIAAAQQPRPARKEAN